jgi:4-diphosphocytidyl-2-C-methyl-D-erythritol kinase
MLVKQFRLPVSPKEMFQLALELGSDCPFFILNKPSIGNSRGEQLEPIELDLSAYRFVLVHPGIHISTRQAFADLQFSSPPIPVREAIYQPPDQWKSTLVNDFEEMAIRQYPELALVKESLYRSGAVYASMSGSGSSFYGIYEKKTKPSLAFKKPYRVDYL